MIKKINELLNEKFEYGQDAILFSKPQAIHRVHQGKILRGNFTLWSKDGRMCRGFLYANDPRIQVKPEMFAGKREECSYTVDLEGLCEGDIFEGRIVACTTAGEGIFPVRVEIVSPGEKEADANVGMTAQEFVALAKEDYGKAYILFSSAGFRALTDAWGESFRALYEGLCAQTLKYRSMEEFLVGMGLKPAVTLFLENDHLLFPSPTEDIREELTLTRETWGFAPVNISCDAEFLTVERENVTTEEFMGSTYHAGFVIHHDKLHAGRNFARIRITWECHKIDCVVEVRSVSGGAAHQLWMQQRQEVLQLAQGYIHWRSGKLPTEQWSAMALQSLDNYEKAGGNHIFFALYRIYVLLQGEQQVRAEVLLQEITERKEELVIPQWKGIYLFLTAFTNTDKTYQEYVREEIRELFLSQQENWILQWLILQVDGNRFRNDSEKLDVIRRQYVCGCISPVMYLEAWEILKREPLMMRSLGDFEIRLLRFLCREDLVNREICGQMAQLAMRCQTYDQVLYRVMCSCFAKYPSKNMLTAICALLMKGRKCSPKYGKWFELGVKQDVRLAGMYEYYAMTAEDLNIKELPRSVRMYFSYSSPAEMANETNAEERAGVLRLNQTLSAQKKAALYANIIRNRTSDLASYETYRPAMALFMEEELAQGKISEDLALLYDTLLTKEVLDETLTCGLAKALFTYEIRCNNPAIRHVVVVHRELAQEQRVRLHEGRALVQMYHDEAVILLEDDKGERCADPSLYTVKRMLNRQMFLEYCEEGKAFPWEMLVHDCCHREPDVTGENLASFVQLARQQRIRTDYRKMLEEKLLVYYSEHPQAEMLEEFLTGADKEGLCKNHKEQLLELLVSTGMCQEAYEILTKSGTDKVWPKTLVRLCHWQIEEKEWEEDPRLCAWCATCFESGIFDEFVLAYLMDYYEGPVESMKHLWQAGQGFSLEKYDFEEKIMALVLFSGTGEAGTEEIFASYYRKQGKGRICRAYAIRMSYLYFVREQRVEEPVFTFMEENLKGEISMPKVCRLALLRWYVEKKERTAGQEKWMLYFLEQFTGQGMEFRFLEQLPVRTLRRFHLHDKYLIEYRTDPKSKVTMHYRLNNGKEMTALLTDMYEGIFVKEFTLFYEDTFSWYLTVEHAGEKKDTQRQQLTCHRRAARGETGQYELLNRLTEAVEKQDHQQVVSIREQYIGQQYFVDEFFGVN